MKAKVKRKYAKGAAWHAAREGKKIVAECKEPEQIVGEAIQRMAKDAGKEVASPIWVKFYDIKEPGLYAMSTQDGVETVRVIGHDAGQAGKWFTADTTIQPFTQIRNCVITQSTFQKIKE